METFYAPTFIDESINSRGKPTGKLSGLIMTRSFFRTGSGKIKVSRGVIPFHWSEDTEEAKGSALQEAIKGMKEMAELDENPPLTFIPKSLEESLK